MRGEFGQLPVGDRGFRRRRNRRCWFRFLRRDLAHTQDNVRQQFRSGLGVELGDDGLHVRQPLGAHALHQGDDLGVGDVDVDGADLSDARAGTNPQSGEWVVNFTFNSIGTKRFADISRARQVLGYAPQMTLEEGLLELGSWLSGQRAFDRVAEASAELEARGLTLHPYTSPGILPTVFRGDIEPVRALVLNACFVCHLHEFALGTTCEDSGFGPVRHPADPTRSPGGSSGGSAIAVATGMSLGSIGTDTGGSIRQPAAFCGLVGLKPTYGRCSRWGIVAFASSLDQAGPMTRPVRDAAIMMGAMASVDPKDSTSVDVPVPDYEHGLESGVKGLRVARGRLMATTWSLLESLT